MAGCAGWRGVRQPEPVLSPPQYLQTESTEPFSDQPWWPAFGDTTLTQLMEEAFTENLTLEQAVARLDQFRASRAAARSSWFPTIRADVSVMDNGDVGDAESAAPDPFSSGALSSESLSALMSPSRYSAGLTAAYELDAWGRLAAGRTAASADLFTGRENLRALTLTLAAQVARTYYIIVELKLQRDLLERTIASYTDSYELVLHRYRRGVAPSLDVYQAETNLAGARAQMALTASNLYTAEHGLAVLLGRYPRCNLVAAGTMLPEGFDDVPPGLPSELVQRRPDVRAAYWKFVAADRRAAEAVAARLPSFSLTGTVTGENDDLADALDPNSMVWNAVGKLILPVFEGGRRKANADRAEAAWREQAASYKQAVLNAFQEVEDALVRANRQKEYIVQLSTQARAAEASLRLATDRYLRGLSDYLPVMVAQATYFNASRGRLSAHRGLVDAHIGLVTALGGGWTDAVIREHTTAGR